MAEAGPAKRSAGSLAGSGRGILSTNSSSDREAARLIGLVHVAGLLCGILLVTAGTLLYLGREHVFGMPACPLALGLLALGAIGFVPALRGLTAFRRAGRSTASGTRSHPLVRGARPGPVCLKLSEPAEGQAEIMLLNAVRRAYRETQGSAAASFASFVGSSETDIAEMYATIFAEHVPVYGRKRPSADIVRITMSGSDKGFAFEDGMLILKERDSDAVYDRLHIRVTDYPLVIARLRSEP